MRAVNARAGIVIAGDVREARRFFSRLRGLMGSDALAEGEALLLVGDSSIHTLFMRYAIDVVYLDADDVVVAIDEKVPPGRIGRFVRRARSVLELAAGMATYSDIHLGDTIVFEP